MLAGLRRPTCVGAAAEVGWAQSFGEILWIKVVGGLAGPMRGRGCAGEGRPLWRTVVRCLALGTV